MKIAFHTLGCKVNQYETEAMKEQFSAAGHEIVDEEAPADAYVINTCTVTSLADRKSRQYIRRMKKQSPQALIAVTGCYAQVEPKLLAEMPEVDIVAGTGEKQNILHYIENYQQTAQQGRAANCHIRTDEALAVYTDQGIITSMESRTRAYIKIQEGCNRFCAYCRIPFARGQVRSRNPQEIVCEAQRLIDAGFKEIILTGINTALYGTEAGFDWPREAGEEDLQGIALILHRLDRLPGDFRIRLSSLEPTVIHADYVRQLLQYTRLCPHLHLSAQSGSDSVLLRMNRHYDRAAYLDIVRVLRAFDPDYGITTDMIVGFPGETEEEFADTLRLIEEAGFSKVHGFRYSRRPKTAAAKMDGQVSGEVKRLRMERLLAADERSRTEFLRGCVERGRTHTVLFEERDEDGLLTGYSENYIRVYAQGADEAMNTFKQVKLLALYKDGLKGEMIDG